MIGSAFWTTEIIGGLGVLGGIEAGQRLLAELA
jgi:hypothetical protein